MKTLTGALWRLRAPLGVLALGGAGSVLLLFVDPNKPGNLLPKCPFNYLTGLNCPGCGVTRMVHALLHGDIAAAWHFNAAMLAIGVPFFLWWFARWTWQIWKGERRPVPRQVPVVLMTLAVIWGVARNFAGV